MKKYTLLPDEIMAYLNEPFDTLDLNMYEGTKCPKDKPVKATLETPEEADCSAGMTLILTVRQSALPPERLELVAGQSSVSLVNLYSGVIYDYKFISHADQREYTGAFETVPYAPRLIDVEGVCNVRDAGGWHTDDGGTMRQGLLYRGSELNLIGNHAIEITPGGIHTMLDGLKIKTDLDLRNQEEAGNIELSPLGAGVNYVRKPLLGYMDIFMEQFIQPLYDIFKLFSNPESYPVYIHCWAGADRTGTVIALLKAALGISYHDITRDFEVSTFAKFGVRGRCNKSFTYVEVFEHLDKNYSGDTLKQKARAFLMQTVGLARQDIENIDKILVER